MSAVLQREACAAGQAETESVAMERSSGKEGASREVLESDNTWKCFTLKRAEVKKILEDASRVAKGISFQSVSGASQRKCGYGDVASK